MNFPIPGIIPAKNKILKNNYLNVSIISCFVINVRILVLSWKLEEAVIFLNTPL